MVMTTGLHTFGRLDGRLPVNECGAVYPPSDGKGTKLGRSKGGR